MKALDRVGAFSGVVWVLLANIGSALIGEGTGDGGSRGEQILDEAERIAANPWTRLALVLVVLANMALIMFIGYLCWRVRDGRWLATTAIVGGTLAVVSNLMSMALVFTTSNLRNEISPELAHTLDNLDGAGHWVQSLPLGVFVLFVSAAALLTHAFNRVLAWVGIAVGAISIIVLAASGLPVIDDSFAWPFLLVLLWAAVVSLWLGFARTRKPVPSSTAAPAS